MCHIRHPHKLAESVTAWLAATTQEAGLFSSLPHTRLRERERERGRGTHCGRQAGRQLASPPATSSYLVASEQEAGETELTDLATYPHRQPRVDRNPKAHLLYLISFIAARSGPLATSTA